MCASGTKKDKGKQKVSDDDEDGTKNETEDEAEDEACVGRGCSEDEVVDRPISGRDEHTGEVATDNWYFRGLAQAQMSKICDLRSLRVEVVKCLDRGEEKAAYVCKKMLSGEASNISTIANLFIPHGDKEPTIQDKLLERHKDNEYMQRWYRQVGARVQTGAEHLVRAVLYWAGVLAKREGVEISVGTVHLMGSELHERGLGVARVDYLLDYGTWQFGKMKCILKPNDRSLERALLGTHDSLAQRLNRKLPYSKRVATLNMDVHPEHGTIVEYVEPSPGSRVTGLLRKFGILYDSRSITIETIALAFLGGIWDLHEENVMMLGGAPVLIDAEVAARCAEYKEGPHDQAAFDFDRSLIEEVRQQLCVREGTSAILQYAINRPDKIIDLIRSMLGAHVARIVPVFTATLFESLNIYLDRMKHRERCDAEGTLLNLVTGVQEGLERELGRNRGDEYDIDIEFMMVQLATDFEQCQIPCFSYRLMSGQVCYGGRVIWTGRRLEDSLELLRQRLAEPSAGRDHAQGEGKEIKIDEEIEADEEIDDQSSESTAAEEENPFESSGSRAELDDFRRQWLQEISFRQESGGSTST